MAQTFIVKGDVVTNASGNNIGRANFVRVTATADTTGTVLDSDDTQLGQFYLENGDTVILEKNPGDKVTCPTSKASAVGLYYEILGTGNIDVFFENDTTKKVTLSGRGNYGLKPGESKIKETVGDVLLTSDSNVSSYTIILETHKEEGFNGWYSN